MAAAWTLDAFLPPPPRQKEEVHAAAMARGARCEVCPLYGAGRGPVMGTIQRNARLTIVGEAPGENELLARESFVGWSGKVLDASLLSGGMRRESCTVTNAALCCPPEKVTYKEYCDTLTQVWKRKVAAALRRGEAPPAPPVFPHIACAPRLARDVAESNGKVLLAVGKQALESLARDMNLPQGAAHVAPGEPYVASIA